MAPVNKSAVNFNGTSIRPAQTIESPLTLVIATSGSSVIYDIPGNCPLLANKDIDAPQSTIISTISP